MVWSQDNLTFVESEIGFSDDRGCDCQRAAGFIPAVSSRPSVDGSLSAAPHYSLMRSAAPPPHTHTYRNTYIIYLHACIKLLQLAHWPRLATGMKKFAHHALWTIKPFRGDRRIAPPQLFGIPVLQGQCEYSGYGSAMSTGAAKKYKFAAYHNVAVINMSAADMGVRERRRMAARFFR